MISVDKDLEAQMVWSSSRSLGGLDCSLTIVRGPGSEYRDILGSPDV